MCQDDRASHQQKCLKMIYCLYGEYWCIFYILHCFEGSSIPTSIVHSLALLGR